MSRRLRKPLDLILKGIAIVLGIFILSINDFDLSALETVLMAVMAEALLIWILNRYGW